jgi:1-acyl-sn-glycerol-3-phosphate acyltransferase
MVYFLLLVNGLYAPFCISFRRVKIEGKKNEAKSNQFVLVQVLVDDYGGWVAF